MVLLVTTLRACWASPKVPEIYVDCGNLFGSGAYMPAQKLCAYLKRYPKANLFRVSWDSSATLGWDDGEALYNRKEGWLKLAYKNTWKNDSREDFVILSATNQQWLFQNIDDRKLKSLLKQIETGKFENIEDNKDAMMGYFPKLVNLGSKRVTLKHFYKTWHEKY